jgi:hypothetical protein
MFILSSIIELSTQATTSAKFNPKIENQLAETYLSLLAGSR